MKTKLNFKYPRARKLLLLFWGMANLAPGTKASLLVDSVFETYCQTTTASQRVPQADFVSELIKAMALLNIVPKQVLVGNQQFLRGIAWSQVCAVYSLLWLSLQTVTSVCVNTVHNLHVVLT